ncbi:MAG: ACP S-malonyltransferase [Treponema sp.]|nr:ACP S-malonyltransferase [Treponema sp.]
MKGKAFFLFPGQGAQYPGMALDFLSSGNAAVALLFDKGSDICGKDMKALLQSDAEVLKRTDVSQPVITLTNLAAAAYLAEKGIVPAGCAGFSLGEYAALAVAGVISTEDCFLLVSQRGKAMQAAVDEMEARGKAADGKNIPGMAAVMGLEPEKVEALIAEWKAAGSAAIQEIYAANINSPKQTVVGGTAEALTEAEALFTAAGARRYMRLQVNCPFHTPLLAGAAAQFQPFLDSVQFKDPQVPVFSNVSGKRVSSGEEAKKMALAQITNPVRWFEECLSIAALGGIDCLLETGPGKVLQGLWKDSGSEIPCYAAGTVADIGKIFE